MERLTVGYRCKLKQQCEYYEYVEDNHVVLKERNSNSCFSVVVVNKNSKLKKRESEIVGELAWICEDELELVDKDLNTNLNFVDWVDNKCHLIKEI